MKRTTQTLDQLQDVLREWRARGLVPREQNIFQEVFWNGSTRQRNVAIAVIGSLIFCVVAIVAGMSCTHGP